MTSTNFDLAPPARTVDGLFAVPADIQQVDAALTFDGATATGAGDATIQFITGTQAGNPIFDLRQTVTGVWLDGLPVPVGQFAQHDFGGGPNAELRVLQSGAPPRDEAARMAALPAGVLPGGLLREDEQPTLPSSNQTHHDP